ncbi:hypothetical protein [Paenibacillus xylaniclasticus]|uniref:hypothetical protein n=1 Tax=Paenibacillus xylaniclasticus TaxID=588083 RepID=UPI001FE68519|nr:hypothetical protein [Paenibacillus xylaniclasticus]
MATRHGAMKTVTNEAKWTGISATLNLPQTVNVTSGYVDWYLGLGKEVVEAGISRIKGGQYKCFLGTGHNNGGKYESVPVSLKDGDKVTLKLIDNGDNTISLFMNGTEIHSKFPVKNGRLGTYNTVKMVHGVEDDGTSSYSQASFSNVQLRANTSGSVYVPWDGSVTFTYTREHLTPNGGANFTGHSAVPLSTSLSKA